LSANPLCACAVPALANSAAAASTGIVIRICLSWSGPFAERGPGGPGPRSSVRWCIRLPA
jgi:hypothetical protein